MGPKTFVEQNCILRKKWVGLKNFEEKICIFGKKIVGGYRKMLYKFFHDMFRKCFPDHPLPYTHIQGSPIKEGNIGKSTRLE